MGKKITIADLYQAKQDEKKIVAVACYDYITARLIADAEVDMALVGDSAAQMVLGNDSTLPATMDYMTAITAAVRRGAPELCLVADMPFLSYQIGLAEAIKNAARFARDAKADIIKIEASEPYLDVIKAVSDAGMAVMAHIGIRPQYIGKYGRYKAEATTAEVAFDLIALAEKMIYAGAATILLEGTAAEVAKIITDRSDVPVISCGSGADCDGQVLIAPDILGLSPGHSPKFAKNYANITEDYVKAFSAYSQDIKTGKFPDDQHCYHMKAGQLDRLNSIIKNRQ